MKIKDKIFWLTYIYLLALVLLRLIPIINPGSRTWGFNHLIFLPDIYTYGFFTIALIALIIPFFRFSEQIGERLSDWFSDKFLDGRRRYLYRFLFIAVLTSLFAIFTAPTHFLGDGYIVINNLISDTAILVIWSEIGIIKLMWSIRELLGPPDEKTSLLAFQIVSIISGSITIHFMFLISQIVSEDRINRFLIFIATFFSGILLLFFGYAEYYPVVWILMTGFVYFSLRFFKSGRGLTTAWLFLIIGIILHIQMIIFIPAAVYLLFAKGNGLIFYGRFKKLIWGIAGFIFTSGLAFLIYKYTTDLYVENMFLPAFVGRLIDPNYTIFSVSHRLDIFNEFILISPLLFLLIIIGGKNILGIFEKKSAIFLGLGAIGSLLFLFVIDPKLTFPRDWDLFSISGFSLLLLSVSLIDKDRIQHIVKLIISLALILSIYSLPFLLTNLNTDSSEKYIESLIELDKSKSLSAVTVLSGYYKENHYDEKYNALISMWKSEFKQVHFIFKSLDAITSGDLESAMKYNKLIKPNKFDSDYHRLQSLINSAYGRYDKAMDHINMAIQLRRFTPGYYGVRADIYFSLKNNELALEDLREGYRLNPKHIRLLTSLVYAHDLLELPDTCIYYARKTIMQDSTLPQPYFYLSKSFALTDKIDSAIKYKESYAQFVENDSTLKLNLEALENIIINESDK